jgi:UPF0042 nucleotide-binding protein
VTDGLRALVVTGLSGSGKSTALDALEDLGFYCIDNLPVVLLPHFVELWQSSREELHRVALGIDAREGRFLSELPRVFDEVRTAGVSLEVLYFEASDDVLVQRFSETRRPHPGDRQAGVVEAIRREREALRGLRERADRIVDTSALTVHELRATLQEQLETGSAHRTMRVVLKSFGFKYGLPSDADLAFDCRFLPNPFFVERLRPLDGTDPGVAHFVLRSEDAAEFVDRVLALLRFALPRYQREGKSYLTIAVGCTGGRHRSVALVERLAQMLEEKGYRARVRHRDLER